MHFVREIIKKTMYKFCNAKKPLKIIQFKIFNTFIGGGGGGGVFTFSGVTHYVEFDFGRKFFVFSKEESGGYMNDLACQ